MFMYLRCNSMKSFLVPLTKDRCYTLGFILLVTLLMGLIMLSAFIGRYPLSWRTVVDVLLWKITGKPVAPDDAQTVLLVVRFPRIITALMVGAGLAMAGLSYQSLFRNPIASPDLLGVSAGAGFGASLAILLHQSLFIVQLSSFCGGLLAMFIAMVVNRLIGGGSIVVLALCGIVVSALFQAFISIVKFVADPIDALASITFLLMGSLAKADATSAVAVSIPVFLGWVLLYLSRWDINLLSLGNQEAASLGVNINRVRVLIITCATLISAATVAVAGIIGWVGLLIPHAGRMLFGLEPSRLLPATAMLGALFLLAIDDLARSLSVVEMPMGILTSIIGAPFFLVLLMRGVRGYWS